MKNPFAKLFADQDLAARAIDNAKYWQRELEKVERERDAWQERYYHAIEAPEPKATS